VFAVAYSGVSRNAVGAGVKLANVSQQFTQGTIDFTGNNLDMALSGRGFFVLSDGGSRTYTP
jgi:flagellar hook protein FlgE